MMREGDMHSLWPIVFGSSNTGEEGLLWPFAPWFMRCLVHWWYERRYRDVWVFDPSDTWWRAPRLAFTGGADNLRRGLAARSKVVQRVGWEGKGQAGRLRVCTL